MGVCHGCILAQGTCRFKAQRGVRPSRVAHPGKIYVADKIKHDVLVFVIT